MSKSRDMSKVEKYLAYTLISISLISLVVVIASLVMFSIEGDKRHAHNKELLNQVKFEGVYNVSKGFFKDCTFIVEERKTLYVFSGTITKCPGNPDVIQSPVEIDGYDFLDLQKGD